MTITIMVALELVLFLAVLGMIELGYRFANSGELDPSSRPSLARKTVTGVVQALMGLILAFSFSGAASRLDAHRTGIVEEANAIGMVWHRTDLARATIRAPLRDLIRGYLDARIRADQALPRLREYERQVELGRGLQEQIWQQAVQATDEGSPAQSRILLLPAISAMTDAEARRTLAVRTHMTSLAAAFMLGLVLVGSLLVGTALTEREGRSWLYRIVFAAVIATAIHVIIDMEYPRLGLDGTQNADRFMIELRQSMN